MRSLFGLTLAALILTGCQSGGDAAKETANDKSGGKPPLTKLEIKDTKEGTGAGAAKGDTLSLKYTGRFGDGEVFDSSEKQGRTFTFVLGQGQAIQGWDQGLVGMKLGGKRELSVPYELAYGAEGGAGIPPKSDLYFEVELVDMTPAGKEDVVVPTVVAPGSGPAAKKGDTVTIHYVGKRVDGSVWESTREKKKPYTFTIGKDETMSGLEYGVIGMKKGAQWTLRIPPKVGAQQLGMPLVDRDSTIIVEVEMLDIK